MAVLIGTGMSSRSLVGNTELLPSLLGRGKRCLHSVTQGAPSHHIQVPGKPGTR